MTSTRVAWFLAFLVFIIKVALTTQGSTGLAADLNETTEQSLIDAVATNTPRPGATLPAQTDTNVEVLNTEVLVYGASLGGLSAAIVLAENGHTVVLAERTDRIGGQAVHAGLSAFDQAGIDQMWQYTGLYRDLGEYVQQKYGLLVSGGLGEAQVGPFASLPGDVEEFFRTRIEQNSNITLLLEHTLVEVTQDVDGRYSTARLVDRQGNQYGVAFKYIVDGTPTGEVYPLAGADYAVGFDWREDTGEPSALPQAVRDALFNGVTIDGVTYPGIGNRVQAVSAVFGVYDKGYHGEFFTAKNVDVACWRPNETPSFIRGQRVYEQVTPSCFFDVPISSDASDIYEIYLINHDNKSARVDVQLDGSDVVYQFRPVFAPTERLVRLGAFYFASGAESHIQLSADRVEGVIIAKTNLHRMPYIVDRPASTTITIDDIALSNVIADIYVHGTGAYDSLRDTVRFADRTLYLQEAGNDLYVARGVSVPSIPCALELVNPATINQIVIVPVSPRDPQRFVLNYTNRRPAATTGQWTIQDDGNFTANGSAEITWQFTPPGAGLYGLFVELEKAWPTRADQLEEAWPTLSDQAEVRISDTASGLIIKTARISQQTSSIHAPMYPGYLSHMLVPDLVAELDANHSYTIAFSNPDGKSIQATALVVFPVERPDYIYAHTTQLRLAMNTHPGIYEIWARPGRPGTVTLTTNGTRQAVQLDNVDRFAHVGFVFVDGDSSDTITADQPVEIYAVPQYRNDVYIQEMLLDGSGSKLTFHGLGAGQYMLEAAFDRSALVGPVTFVDASGYARRLDVQRGTDGQVALIGFYLHTGGDLTVEFPPAAVPLAGHVALYERFPTQFDAISSFELRQQPFLALGQDQELRSPFFEYRNIVSPTNFFELDLPFKYQANIASNTFGVALVALSSSDYAPVYSHMLDSPDMRVMAQEYAYQFYYWVKYGVNQAVLGCSRQAIPICDTRRISFATDLYGTATGFPVDVYIREGRRLITKDPLREQDIAFDWVACEQEGTCNDWDRCYSFGQIKGQCIKREQEPAILDDAIFGAYYRLDSHGYLTRFEFTNLRWRALWAYIKTFGVDNCPLQWYKSLAKPVSITLGSLVPADDTNLYPASTNFGVTQIANSALRVHTVELAVGQATGYLLSYALDYNISPSALWTDTQARIRFQEDLIARNVPVYPIDGITDPQLMRAAQYLLLHGYVKPQVVLSAYRFDFAAALAEEDSVLLAVLDPGWDTSISIADLLRKAVPAGAELDDQELLERGVQAGLVDADAVLSGSPQREMLFKAAYVILGHSSQ